MLVTLGSERVKSEFSYQLLSSTTANCFNYFAIKKSNVVSCTIVIFLPSTQPLTSSGVSAMKFITRLAVIRVKELGLKSRE